MKTLLLLVSIVMGDDSSAYSFKHEDLVCASLNTWHESRGEDALGRLYVAQTVRNRVLSDDYPNDVCDAIYAKGAFEWTADGKPDEPVLITKGQVEHMLDTIVITASALEGDHDGIIMGATDYYAHNKVTPCWKTSFDRSFRHGNHTWMFDRNEKTPCWDKLQLARNP